MSDYEIKPNNDALMEAEHVATANDFTDTEVLQHTRQIKLQIVDTLTNGGISSDPKDVNALMKVLDSIDRTAHGNIRNSIDQDNSAALGEALAIIAAVQKQVGNTDPFMMVNPGNNPPRDVTIEQRLVEHDFVEGELSQELKDLQYDSFVDNFESK